MRSSPVPTESLRTLADLALATASHSARFLELAPEQIEELLIELLREGRRLYDDWLARLPAEATSMGLLAAPRSLLIEDFVTIVNEAIVADVLLRVFCTTLVCVDRYRGVRQSEPVLAHLHLRNLQVRRRWLEVLLDHPHAEKPTLTRLNDLRRKAERWCDLLIGPAACRFDVTMYGHSRERVAEYGASQLSLTEPQVGDVSALLTLAGFRLAFLKQVPESEVTSEPLRAIGCQIRRVTQSLGAANNSLPAVTRRFPSGVASASEIRHELPARNLGWRLNDGQADNR